MADNSSNNKRIAKNTMFLYVRMLFALFVSLYTSRVVLKTLGVNDYGTYNVVAGFVSMFGFINATLSSSMQRFYNYEGTRYGQTGYYNVYCSGLVIHALLALLLFFVLESFGIWYVNKVMIIPAGRLFAANIVFQTSVISLIFVLLQIPYVGAILAVEKMDFYAIINIIDVVLKLVAVIFLPYLPYDKLVVYGILFLFITLFNFAIYFTYSKKIILKFRFKKPSERNLYHSILNFSGWNMIGTFAFLLKGQGLNILLNAFFGTVINAARGIANQVNSAISGFSANIFMAFRPQIVNSLAEGNFTRCNLLLFTESKICFCLFLLLMTPFALEIDYILNLWLGKDVPSYTNVFSLLVCADSLVCSLNTPISQVAYATGKIKKYQINSSVVNLCLLPVCWFCLLLGFDATAVFFITLFFSVINQFVCVVSLKKVFEFSIIAYFKKVIFPCMIATVIIPIIPFMIRCFIPSSFSRLFIIAVATILVFIPYVSFVVLNKIERRQILNFIRK